MTELKTSREQNHSDVSSSEVIKNPFEYKQNVSTSDNTIRKFAPNTKNSIRKKQNSAEANSQDTQIPVGNITFVPIKIKDFMKLLQDQINIKNSQIEVLGKNNSPTKLTAPQEALNRIPVVLPTYTKRHSENKNSPQSKVSDSFFKQTNQKVFAMPDIQAFPLIGSSGFRANRGRRKKDRTSKRIKRSQSSSQPRSQRRIRSKSRLRKKPKSRSRFNRSRSRSKSTLRSRSKVKPLRLSKIRSTHERIRYKKVRPPRKRSQVVIRRQKNCAQTYEYDLPCCTPYPLCDNEYATSSKPMYTCRRQPPEYMPRCRQNESECNLRSKKPLVMRKDYDGDKDGTISVCPCESREYMQFIQPGLCSKRKYLWTNEYAIIPKPQINLIDPCEDLDPIIHPIANKPCIRDRTGNPLTDCIGRPLRDPTGRKFLKFTANGSILDTNFRGNFYTAQPPLCVKQPLPKCPCAPDTTHTWWMTGGHPIVPDMGTYFRQVVKNENKRWE